MLKKEIIKLDPDQGQSSNGVPVVDLEVDQKNEELILVGQKKRKKEQQRSSGRKRRKIIISEDSSVDPLYLFEQKEIEFRRIRNNFPSTDPLLHLPFEVIENIIQNLYFKDCIAILSVNKGWQSCRDILPWRSICERIYDVKLLGKQEGSWYQRFKTKRVTECNWKLDKKRTATHTVGRCVTVLPLTLDSLFWVIDYNHNTTRFYKVIGTQLEWLFESEFMNELLDAPTHPGQVDYVTPVHVISIDDQAVGITQNDRQWSLGAPSVYKWNVKSDSIRQLSLEDIFSEKLNVSRIDSRAVYPRAKFDLEEDLMVYSTPESAVIVRRISSFELLRDSNQGSLSTFFHVVGDYIIYKLVDFYIMNWRTEQIVGLPGIDRHNTYVAVSLPKKAFKDSTDSYCILAGSNYLALINLTNATVERTFVTPVKFAPKFLQLWPFDKTKIFTVGGTIHIWSIFDSKIESSFPVHPVHPFAIDVFPKLVKLHDNKIFVSYEMMFICYVLAKNEEGFYELVATHKDPSIFDFDDSHLYLSTNHPEITICDYAPAHDDASSVTRHDSIHIVEVID